MNVRQPACGPYSRFATTPTLKARLLKEAENHEQLAEELEDLIEAPVA